MQEKESEIGELDTDVPNYQRIIKHYESCLEKHGDTVQGVDWPNIADAKKRYGIMLDVIKYASGNIENNRNGPIRLLDFGCGSSLLYGYIQDSSRDNNIEYSGLDLSKKFIELSKNKYPDNTYYHLDILKNENQLPSFDYIVLNGVFTEKRGLAFKEMFQYFKRILKTLYPNIKKGMAVNVMSNQVDWTRDDLFHLPMDTLAEFLITEFGRNFVIRNDYQLYEYTTYIYKQP